MHHKLLINKKGIWHCWLSVRVLLVPAVVR